MNLSKRWLLDYVNINVSHKEFADAMTMSGSKVEGFETEGEGLTNIVVGKILSLSPHPDSDHLWVCAVDVGEGESTQIVTGAQNLKENDVVPVALHNSVVASGQKIKKGKLRGVESNGMLCSLEELGLTLHDFPYAIEDGIFVLGDDCDLTLGKDIQSAIGLNDVVTEFEITSNRPDCLSVTGLAREAAATFDLPLNIKEPSVTKTHGNVADFLSVDIENKEKCYRYAGAVVENVRVASSPRWLRERLRASGVRPINNIVDITNYVMLEYGQPMHAFDLRYLDGGSVIVRNAKDGEKITTLDDIERELSSDMLVIADSNKPVAVAGVMGGEYSGIMDDTTTIVFESACFNGASVRKTAKKLGMRTEASARFEKELDPAGCLRNLMRALELVEILDAGDIVSGVVDCDYSGSSPVILDFDPEWTNKFIGIDLNDSEQKKILEKIGFVVENGKITVPSFRNDIEHQADLSEEIARFYGYENIPNHPLTGAVAAKLTAEQKFNRLTLETLVGCGLSEIATYSFISPKAYDKIALASDSELRKSVVITNPLGEDTSVMRTTMLPSMMDILARNYKNRNLEAGLFEIAFEYFSQGAQTLPLEKSKAIIGIYGGDADFYSLKGIVEKLLKVQNVSEYSINAVTNNPSFHPGRTAELTIDNTQLAILGEVHPNVCKNYDIDVKVYAAVIDMTVAFDSQKGNKTYAPLPKYPATARDLAFICDKEITVGELEREIKAAVGKILENITLFDVYEGSQIPDGKKSVAFSLTLRSHEKTLTDEDSERAMKKIIAALEKMKITLRS